MSIAPYYFFILVWLAQCVHCFVQLDFDRVLSHSTQGLSKRDDGNDIKLENVVSYYRAQIMIGTPPQLVSVQIDTGSSDLWVISTTNPLCRSRLKCPQHAMFDSQRSSSFHRNESTPFAIAYGDSTYANGTFAQDTIQIGGTQKASYEWKLARLFGRSAKSESDLPLQKRAHQGITIQNANFAVAETANSTEAVWGIGMESTESMVRGIDPHGRVFPSYPNLPVQMKQQGYIDTVAYSLWLNDLYSSQGSLLMGGVDNAKYSGTLQTVPMVSSYSGIGVPMDFSVMLHGVSAYNSFNDSASLINCSLPFLLDSGTTYSQMPMEFLKPIMNTIGAVLDETDGVYLIDDEQKAMLSGGGLTFNLSGIEINVDFEELLIPIGTIRSITRHSTHEMPDRSHLDHWIETHAEEGKTEAKNDTSHESMKARRRLHNYYLVGIYPANNNAAGAYILGDTFLRSAYAVYDLENKEISLANTVYNTTTSNITNIDSNGVPDAIQAPYYSSTSVAHEVSTYVASGLFSRQRDRSHSTPASGATSGTTSIRIIPSHAAPWDSSMATTASKSTLHKHERHTNGSHKTLVATRTAIGMTLMSLLLILV